MLLWACFSFNSSGSIFFKVHVNIISFLKHPKKILYAKSENKEWVFKEKWHASALQILEEL